MTDHWELLDVYKALLAVAAGVILGLEREMKDKVAGLKTITIICLGAALFAILSYKIGGWNYLAGCCGGLGYRLWRILPCSHFYGQFIAHYFHYPFY